MHFLKWLFDHLASTGQESCLELFVWGLISHLSMKKLMKIHPTGLGGYLEDRYHE